MESTPDTQSMVLRDVMRSDLPICFDQQLDPEANRMAAFTRKDPADRGAFMAHWAKILRDETLTIQTILCDGQVAGSVLSYVDEDGQLEVSYWIGRPYWGKGVATRGLLAFLDHIKVRPLYARAAQDNIGSLRVLEKCRFTRIGEGRGFSEARGQEVEEFLLRLDQRRKAAFPALLDCMEHPFAKQGKASLPVALSFDKFQLGYLTLDHAVIDPPGEASSHCLLIFLHACGKGLQFRKVTSVDWHQPVVEALSLALP